MKNYVSSGAHFDVTLAAPVTSGDLVTVGDLVGVAQSTGIAGATIALVRCGIFTLPKLEAQAWTVGQKVYWDSGNSRLTTVASGNRLVGVASAIAANPSTTGEALLDGVTR